MSAEHIWPHDDVDDVMERCANAELAAYKVITEIESKLRELRNPVLATFSRELAETVRLAIQQRDNAEAALQSQREGWIAVSERLPDDQISVLIVVDGDVWMGWHEDDEWRSVDAAHMEQDVTHWQPLPAGPGAEYE